MAENEKIIGMKEFYRSTAAPSAAKAGGNIKSDTLGKQSESKTKMSQLRQPSAITKPNSKKDVKSEVMSYEEKGERSKLLREKQIEERKKKHEERKTAVEERRRQKEKEDSVKNETLRNLLGPKGNPGSRGVGSGRKLPNLPADGCYPRRQSIPSGRLSSGSSSGDSPSDTPPGSAKGTKMSRRDLTGPSSASTSCLSNVGNGRPQSRTKTNMSKKTSASTNNLMDNTLSTKPAGKLKEKSVVSKAHPGSGLPKARSMGAIHQVGSSTKRNHSTSKPSSGKKTKGKSNPVHHAGRDNPEDAKKALAEHRRKIREEAERQALLDKEKQEKLRIQREEDEKRLAEENAKEMARQQELALILKGQEEERAKLLQEQKEKEEAERIEAEIRRKEELEMLKKQEQERRVKEVEKREKEEEERLKRDEEERQERRKRVEMIMSRTRMTAATTNNNFKIENNFPQEDLATQASDDIEYQSTTVSEILQKVKEKSRVSPNPEQDLERHKENQNMEETTEKNTVDWKNENSMAVLQTINDTSKLGSLISENEDKGIGNDSSNIVSLSLRQYCDDDEVRTRYTEVNGRTVGKKTNFIKNITQGSPNVESEKRHNADLWENLENFMQASENHARGNLERNGGMAEGEDDEDGEEGQLWKVVEGKREISDVV